MKDKMTMDEFSKLLLESDDSTGSDVISLLCGATQIDLIELGKGLASRQNDWAPLGSWPGWSM